MTPDTPISSVSVDPVKRLLIIVGLIAALSASLYLIWIERHRVVPIIMYHHIDDFGKYPVATVPTDHFEKHLQYLHDHQFEVLSYDAFIAAKLNKEPLSRKTVVLTFDDGYADNFDNAFPLLRKYNYPATLFISTEKVGLPGYMTWAQLREMLDAGMTIGSHSVMHEYLPDLSQTQRTREVRDSRWILEEKLGVPVKHFSYPVGGFNDEIKAIVRQAGYQSAVTTNRGFDRFNNDFFEINRVTMDEEDIFGPVRWAKFSGYYNLFRKSRKPQ